MKVKNYERTVVQIDISFALLSRPIANSSSHTGVLLLQHVSKSCHLRESYSSLLLLGSYQSSLGWVFHHVTASMFFFRCGARVAAPLPPDDIYREELALRQFLDLKGIVKNAIRQCKTRIRFYYHSKRLEFAHIYYMERVLHFSATPPITDKVHLLRGCLLSLACDPTDDPTE